YLIYFLFVDLLGFPNYGRAEKVAWGIPFDYEGNAFLIAHHKFGIRLTAQESPTTEAEAAEVVCLIRKGVNKAEPFFRWLADRAVSGAALNVVNRSRNLFERFEFYLEEYKKKVGQANAESDEGFQIPRVYTKLSDFYLPPYKRWLESGWLGLAVIDAFFSWTEHIFIHLAILKGHLTMGAQVAELAKGDWSQKFKEA